MIGRISKEAAEAKALCTAVLGSSRGKLSRGSITDGEVTGEASGTGREGLAKANSELKVCRNQPAEEESCMGETCWVRWIQHCAGHPGQLSSAEEVHTHTLAENTSILRLFLRTVSQVEAVHNDGGCSSTFLRASVLLTVA